MYTTRAIAPLNEPEEARFNLFYLAPSLLVTGTNVVAVEVHQQVTNTNDCSFDLALLGQTAVTATTTTTVVRYGYDPLYRLTSAAYSGAYTYTFGYTYDAVGNRTVQTRTITSTQVTTYTYDATNRMTKAGGITYTWDNNGNLINDGSATYLYDRTNRLISTTLSGVTSLYGYNGDGARLRQIIAGVPTTYTQDLVAPLPVVLQAKTGAATTPYLFAMGTRPIAQYTSGSAEYLLPDALGSVRQIADASGSVLATKSYEPYGTVLSSSGSANSMYGFTGEQTDGQTGLLFLRARYMQPKSGVFLSRDPWSGDQMRPGSMNGWNYAGGNPIRYIDPSGRQAQCRVGRPEHPWDCEAVNNVVALKDAFLDSASRHNKIPTMDNNGFAALVASVIVSEGLIGNIDRRPKEAVFNFLQGISARLGCIVSGWAFKNALSDFRLSDAAAYALNHQGSLGNPQLATVGIGNVSIATAANLWIGQACDSNGNCLPAQVNKMQWTDTDNQLVDVSNPFEEPAHDCWYYRQSGYVCTKPHPPTEIQVAQRIEAQLLNNKINIEYVAANLEAGALRAASKGFQASAFNVAAWHLAGVQTNDEIDRSGWWPCPDGACLIVEDISTALSVLGLSSSWNISTETQYARNKSMYHR